MGVIPDEWVLQQLGEICDVRDGTHESPRFYSEGVPLITSKNIVNGSLDLENTSYISEQDANGINKRSKVDTNDILMSMIGTIGSAVLVDFEPDFCIKNVALIKPQRVLPTFLIYLITSPLFQAYLKDSLDGGIQKFVALGTLRRLNIPLPSPAEQHAIAEALSDVDKLLGSLEKLIAKKRAIKQATMQQLLTGKTRLPGFSGPWEHEKLADFGVFRSGSGFPLAFQGRQSGAYPFFKVSDLNNKGNELLLKNANHWISEEVRRTLGATKFSAGSIVFAKIGAAIFLERKRLLSRESCLDNNMMAFSLTAPEACEQFFHYLFLCIELGKLVSTTALPSLSGREIGTISVPLPPPDEQHAIATVLSDMDAEITALKQRRDKTHAIKQGMMQQLLTGRVRLVSAREGNAHAS